MNDVEIKFSRQQYNTFIRALYFLDYCAWNGLVSGFKSSNTEEHNKLSEVIELIYSADQENGIAKSISLNSFASEVPFSETEALSLQHKVEDDLDNIAHFVFANMFAKRELNFPNDDQGPQVKEIWLTERRLLAEHMPKYINEFKSNGISNLRFRMFHKPIKDETTNI